MTTLSMPPDLNSHFTQTTTKEPERCSKHQGECAIHKKAERKQWLRFRRQRREKDIVLGNATEDIDNGGVHYLEIDESQEYIDPCYVDVQFDTTDGISQGLLGVTCNEETRALFAYMHGLTRSASRTLRTVKFRINVDPASVYEQKDLLGALNELITNPSRRRALYPYRSCTGEIRIPYNLQWPRLMIKESWQTDIVRFRSSSLFYDTDAYLAKMAYGSSIKWRVSILNIEMINGVLADIELRKMGSTIVAIVHIDKGRVNDNLMPEEMKGTDVILPKDTNVKIILYVPTVDARPAKRIKVQGFTISRYIENSDPKDIRVCLNGPCLENLFVDNASIQTIRYEGGFAIDINDAPIRRQMEALHKLQTNENGVDKWIPLLLNHEYEALPTEDILKDTQEDVVKSALDRLHKLRN